MYLELHSASAFSFLEGAAVPEELVEVCAALDMPAMALLDRDGIYGVPRFHLAAKKLGLRAHIGSEITVREPPQRHRNAEEIQANHECHSDPERSEGEEPAVFSPRRHGGTEGKLQITNCKSPIPMSPCLRGEPSRLPLLVQNRPGYQNLCRLITRMKMRGPKDAPPELIAAREEDLRAHASGLVCLTGGEDGPLARALARGGSGEARRELQRLVAIFGRESVYVELQRHYLRDEEARNQAAIVLARQLGLPLLATNGVRYARPEQRQLFDVLTVIRHHRTLATAGRLLSRNSERYLKSPAEMQKLFSDLPEAIANTAELSARLGFTLADLGYEFPRYPVPEGETMMSFLRQRTGEGFRERYGGAARDLRQRAQRQVERELALIEKLDLAGYFLIVWDIVRFCRQQGILVQGRGSAANSAVCYSLGITAVDPVGMDLLFERFLSEERGEWPDIDLDLPSGEQRERAIQYVYQRYGEPPPQHANSGRAGGPGFGAAMTANVITYRGRLAAREIGKALGFDLETLGRLSSLVGSWEYKDPGDTLERHFRDAGFDLRHPRLRQFLQLCLAVQDLPRHLGQHSGGMVICQGQLDSVVPLEPASMPGRVVVQWDKEDCANMGIIKVDLLGLGMMAVLEDSLQLIRDHSGEEVDLARLPPDDPAVYAALQKADTVGMFQIESRAQMSCLPRLRPQKFYDIVVQVAIIRPGPIVGKMVHPYLTRRQGREPVLYPHPALEPVLARTLGVPLFQEQLLRMAMITAGFTGGEAEELRRAMGFKRSEKRMREIEIKLRAGMERNGISGPAQDGIVNAITAFALYGFPESHAASFALIAYASAWLKTHYLAAFTAALLNNQPMGFYHPATLVKDAQRHGLKVLPIDVVRSDWRCTLEHESTPRRHGDTEESRNHNGGHSESEGCEGEEPAFADRRSPDGSDTAAPLPNQKSEIGNQRSSVPPCLRGEHEFAVRLGLCYARGLREEAARALVRERQHRPFTSLDDLVRRVSGLRKNELILLAEIGAFKSFDGKRTPQRHGDTEEQLQITNCQLPIPVSPCLRGETNSQLATRNLQLHRRSALWQVERAARPAGPLFQQSDELSAPSPLAPMTPGERLLADFRGTGLTVGPHPMAYHRRRLDALGILRACDLPRQPNGRRVRAAGCVIARQRPGTARGFVFLSLEDETGIANAIITPDLFDQNRLLLVAESFLLVEGPLQNQDNVVSVKAERVSPLRITAAETASHDFF